MKRSVVISFKENKVHVKYIHEYKLEICYKLRVLKLVLQCCTEQVEQQGREH